VYCWVNAVVQCSVCIALNNACTTTEVTAVQAAYCKDAFQRKHIALNRIFATHKLCAERLVEYIYIEATTTARVTTLVLMALTDVYASAQQACQ
jgi:hypothetical protein